MNSVLIKLRNIKKTLYIRDIANIIKRQNYSQNEIIQKKTISLKSNFNLYQYSFKSQIISMRFSEQKQFNNQKQIKNKNQFNTIQDKRQLIISKKIPFTSIGLLRVILNNKNYTATAFLIGDNIAITSAQNIYCQTNKKFLTGALLTFGLSEENLSFYQIMSAFVPSQYINSSKSNQFDYAILILDTNQKLGKLHGCLSINTDDIEKNSQVSIYGFPLDKNLQRNKTENYPDENSIRGMFGCQGKIKNLQGSQIYHEIYTNQGQSGSPILRKNSNSKEYQVIGIQTETNQKNNKGILLTRQVIKNINKWISQCKQNIKNPTQRIDLIDKNYDFSKISILKVKQKSESKQQTQEQTQAINQGYQLFDKGQQYLYQKSDNQLALNFFKQALSIYEKIKGKQSISVALILNQIGVTYQNLGNYDNALENYSRSLKIKEKVSGKLTLDFATTLNNVGNIYYNKQNLQLALKCYEESLMIKILVKGKQDIQCVNSINNIAGIYSIFQEVDKSIQYYKRALDISIKTYGQNNIQHVSKLNNLGTNYFFKKNDKEKGMEYFQKSVKIFKANNISQHVHYAHVLLLIGQAQKAQNKFNQALEYFEKTKEMYEKMLGKNNQNPHYKRACESLNQTKNELKKQN